MSEVNTEKKDKKKARKVILDIYAPAFLMFLCVVMIGLGDWGFYLIFPLMTIYDTYVMHRKNFFINLAINAITAGTFYFLLRKIITEENKEAVRYLSVFAFGFYSAFFSYVIAGKIAKVRIDKVDYI